MNTTSRIMTPDQILASRDRLISEGFAAGSPAIRVHDQLLGMMESGERHTEAASTSIQELQAECERMHKVIQRVIDSREMPGPEYDVKYPNNSPEEMTNTLKAAIAGSAERGGE